MTDGPSRRELRRQVGPVAWCALEDIAEDAQVDAIGHRVAITSVRQLAANLGVSKDTAARALLRLRHVGLVEPLAPARGDSGRFGHASYLLLTSAAAPTPPAPLVRPSSSARAAARQQPSLFDDGIAGTAASPTRTREPETREPETREPQTREPQTREPQTREPQTRNADGRDGDDGEAVHTLAPCGAVSSPAGAGARRARSQWAC